MSNKYEIVYLVQHKNIPQYTKIGYTTRNDLSKRIKELNTASLKLLLLMYLLVEAFKWNKPCMQSMQAINPILNGIVCQTSKSMR